MVYPRGEGRRAHAVDTAVVALAVLLPAATSSGPGPPFAARETSSAGAPSPALPISLPAGSQTGARLPAPAPPPPWGPVAGQQGLVFTPGGAGLLFSGPGQNHSGSPLPPAQVQETTDQGLSWSTLWRGNGYRITWAGMAGPRVVAAGVAVRSLRPFLLEANSTGTSWRMVKVSISAAARPPGIQPGMAASAMAQIWGTYRFYFVNQSLGFAAPDPSVGVGAIFPAELLRTTDGGAHWAPVHLPGGTPSGGLAFVTGERGFATGNLIPAQTSKQCPLAQIWSTSDGGSTWAPVPGTCADAQLTSLFFLNRATGFAAGGQYLKLSGYGQQLLMLKTTDEGQRWSTIYHGAIPGTVARDINPFAAVAFFNVEDGLALDGGQTMGGNAPIGGHLWRTTDGGRHWSQLNVEGLRLVLDGPQDAWLIGGDFGTGGAVLWRSLDRGRTWLPVGNPGRATVTGVAGYGPDLWASTEAGDFSSADGGHSWHRPPAALGAAETSWPYLPVQLAAGGTVFVGPGGPSGDRYWLSNDGDRTGAWHQVPSVASGGVVAMAFGDAKHGLAIGPGGECDQTAGVLATSNGGRVWRPMGGVDMNVVSLAYDGPLAVAAGSTCAATNIIAISTDSGRTWSDIMTTNLCSPASVFGLTVVMLCDALNGAQYLMSSADGGAHWATVAYNPPGAPEQIGSVVTTGTSTVWASGPPGVLWHTSDAGTHWQAWSLLLPLVP